MFKSSLLLVSFIALFSSGIFAGSRIIISGNSSLIIDSKDDKTHVIAGTIETVSGGQFLIINVLDVQDDNSLYDGLPTAFVIEKAYPNPFNPTTRIRYGVPNTTPVNVAIYDMTGRLISDYKIGDKEPGWHEFTWQGTDSYGQQVSTGVYLITMRAGDEFQRQKVTFLK